MATGDSIPRMLEQVKAPVRALLGPWNHSYPNDADFGPRMEWREDAVRWWDYWLKARDTGVLEDPKLRHLYAPLVPARSDAGNSSGRMAGGDGVAAERREEFDSLLAAKPHAREPCIEADTHRLKYIPSMGVEAGFWWGELLSDQRPVDAFSLVYDSAPLKEELAINGTTARVAASRPADALLRTGSRGFPMLHPTAA